MNLKEIRELINLMNENDLTEIEIEREGIKVKIKKGALEHMEASHRSVVYRPEVPSPKATVPVETVKPADNAAKRLEIQSPMVGTFYRSPSPESPAFVDTGAIVEVGQVVCIVEAMKLMNEIKSEFRGKVVEIPAQNAQPVEFGQVLFYLEPV